MQFMTCTTCKSVVQVNATGICMACQQGFNKAYEVPFSEVVDEALKLEELQQKEKEIEEAIKKKEESENSNMNHKKRSRSKKTTRPNNRNSPKPSGEVKEEEGEVNDN